VRRETGVGWIYILKKEFLRENTGCSCQFFFFPRVLSGLVRFSSASSRH
jgi:predicted nucleic acid-binding Zn finger protein